MLSQQPPSSPSSRFPEQPPTIPGYSFERDVERGVVGCVWLYRRDRDARRFSVKSPQHNPAALARFHRETDALLRLDHAHVIRIVRAGGTPDRPWYVTRHYHRGNLQSMLGRGPMGWGQIARGVLGLVGGLAHAHERGVIHRDVRPANVLIRSADRWVLTDFGPAPELDDGLYDQADRLADVFAVGRILNALTRGWGRRVPATLAHVIARCLAPRELRYPDALALRTDLRRLVP